MLHLPSGRKSRRYSSGSGSLAPSDISTIAPSDPARPSSSSRVLHQPSENASISEVLDYNHRLHKQINSASSKRPSEHAGRGSEEVNDGVPNRNRWSSSTASSTSGSNHRRRSSFSKRFSLGTSSFNNGLRSLSPSKARQHPDGPSIRANSPPSESSPASLPSVNRFSPITLPNLSYGSTNRVPITSKSLPAPPETPSSADPHHNPESFQEVSNGTTSPQKRQREPASRAGSHLSDILESDRSPRLASSPKAPNAPKSSTEVSQQERPKSRRGTSRDTSPVKREHIRTQPQTRERSRSADRGGHAPVRRRSKKDKDKRNMLSKALKRANEAVILDNEQNYFEAVSAYGEACELLDLVMARTVAETERAKLTSIRGTYLSRIQELQHIKRSSWSAQDVSSGAGSTDSIAMHETLDGAKDQDMAPEVQTATASPFAVKGLGATDLQHLRMGTQAGSATVHQPLAPTSRRLAPVLTHPGNEYVPPPLSPQRSPIQPAGVHRGSASQHSSQRESGVYDTQQHRASETGSWLITGGDEAVSSGASRHHSVTSVDGVRRKDLRAQALNTEAEFDAALDAAIESAYPDGFEPYEGEDYEADMALQTAPSSRTSDPMADQSLSYAQREAKIQRLSQHSRVNDHPDILHELSENESGLDSEEEDRLLDVGREPHADTNAYISTQTQQPVPRQSDSSGYSGRTWGSSDASSLNTAGTSLGTVDENASLPSLPPNGRFSKPAIPHVADSLATRSRGPQFTEPVRVGEEAESTRSRSPLRDRRLSAQRAKGQLRIETSTSTEASPDRSKQRAAIHPESPSGTVEPEQSISRNDKALSPSTGSSHAPSAFRLDLGRLNSTYPSPLPGSYPHDAVTPPTPNLQKTLSNESNQHQSPYSSPPRKSERPKVKQNMSSMSLGKHVLLGGRTPDELEESPGTPMSFAFPATMSPPTTNHIDGRLGAPMATPVDSTFGSPPAVSSAKMQFLDNEIHSPTLPGAPNPDLSDAPKALEPCPESTLLRPFWLMRCFYQTLVHPKGGYVTTKLFVPHDVWKVKNVKLKGIEEKIANCDLLTAALLKLGGVDTLDADAVLVEMQSLECVLEQVQSSLSKKLGNEVGVHGISSLFKEAPTSHSPPSGDPNATQTGNEGTTTSTGGKTSSKGYLNSWRKLRSKSSSTSLALSYMSSREMPKDGLSMNSLPMTSNIEGRRGGLSKRERSTSGSQRFDAIEVEGPNANYAGALARLCDAAQALDQIARQVRDPGLNLSSPTYVGLELSARHAAEFFGFYICRFILQDLIMLTEKYVKRASEFVVA